MLLFLALGILMETIEIQQLDALVVRLNEGDDAARESLVQIAQDRLMNLTRRMLKGFPGVKRWEETGDVWQNAAVRLWKSLDDVQPNDATHFLRLAALQIRRELIELARRYSGPLGLGANHATTPEHASTGETMPLAEGADQTFEGTSLAMWTEFHETVQLLDDQTREVFDLLWYQGLQQTEAASLLGVSERTVKRRWQAARLELHDRLGDGVTNLA